MNALPLFLLDFPGLVQKTALLVLLYAIDARYSVLWLETDLAIFSSL